MTTTATATPQATRERLLGELRIIKERRHDTVPAGVLAEYSDAMGLTTRHVQRLVGRKVPTKPNSAPGQDPRQKPLNEKVITTALFKSAGNAKRAYEELTRCGHIEPMSLRTFQRRISKLDAAVRACASGGYRAMVKYQFFNSENVPHRCYAYGIDHTKLPIRVLPKRGLTPAFAWCTFVVDLYSRLILGWLLSIEDPNTERSVSAILEAVVGRNTEDGFIGGKPLFVRSDRGSDLISEAMTKGLLRLGIERQFTEPYSSWQNGRVERVNGTVDRDFAPTCKGYLQGGEEEYNRRTLKVSIADADLEPIDVVEGRLAEWIDKYNNRSHRALGGKTPIQAWFADPTPIEKMDHETAALAMMRGETRRLNKYGIELNNEIYTLDNPSRTSSNLIGEPVEVRYLPHRLDYVELFHHGQWFSRATKATERTSGQIARTVKSRKTQRDAATEAARAAHYDRSLEAQARARAQGVPDDQLPRLSLAPDDRRLRDKLVAKYPDLDIAQDIEIDDELDTIIGKTDIAAISANYQGTA